MRLQLTVVVSTPQGGRPVTPTEAEVEVEAPEGSTAHDLACALADALDVPGDRTEASLCVAQAVVDPRTTVGTGPLVDGAAVTLTLTLGRPLPPPRRPPSRRTPVVLAIAHGPDAGRTIELLPGEHTVGRGPEATITIDDPRISRLHAVVTVTADAITVADPGSTNGTELDGAAVGPDPQPARLGATLQMGDSLLELRSGGGVPAALTVRDDGTAAVSRRPRLRAAPPPRSIALPQPPDPPDATRVPWLPMLLPLPVAGVMALVFGPMVLAFALMTPVLMAGNVIGDRLTGKRRYAGQHAAYLRRLREARDRVDVACREEAGQLARAFPDPAQTLLTATTPTAQVWERRRTDPDAFTVSVGWCSTPSSLRVEGLHAGKPEQPLLHRVPCTLALGEMGVTGFCGDRTVVMDVLRAALGQLVALHSPRDLELVLVTAARPGDESWSWLGRLPHVRGADGRARPGSLLALERTDAARAGVAALADVVRQRTAHHGVRDAPWPGPRTLVVVDGVSLLRELPELAVVLEHGPSVGIIVVATADDRSGLPSECRAVLDLGSGPLLCLPDAPPARLVVDRVGPWWADRLSRGLSPLRDATPGQVGASLETAGLCALLGLDSHGPVDAAVASTWSAQPCSTSVPVGHTADGPFTIDLAADGPHVLVAGTTGAGKSELLRTLVTSLAVHNRPEHLSTVLVDYKGGAAFRDLAHLPHVAALVTDLDDHLASRALISLRAELKSRERLMASAGVPDFVAYQCSPSSTLVPLPRLVIVVDEFRALAEELPAFVDGIVAVASLGRSLGIHLVLATQRPAGVVTADIKANLNLRIALRLRDRSDSLDVIDAADAAALDPASPGRAVARVADGALTTFQTAHAGARTEPSQPRGIRVRRLTWGEAPPPWPGSGHDEASAPTELSVLVGAVSSAATLVGARSAQSPWLPPLPEHVPEASLPRTSPSRCPVGLVDEPDLQRQRPLEVALDEPGHWGFVGGSGSGRSTALLTLAGSATSGRGPHDLHVYAVSGGSLSSVQSLPHCGAHVAIDDLPRLERLLVWMSRELALRRELLTASGRPSMQHWLQAEAGAAPPVVLLLVDDWDLLVDSADHQSGQVATRVLGLLREGAGLGLTAALAGDRALLVGRAAAALTHRVVLRMNDPTDLLLAGLTTRQLPIGQPPGRGLLVDGTEVQIAEPRLLTGTATMRAPAADRRSRSARGPRRVDALPAEVAVDSLPRADQPGGPVWVGVGGDELAPRGLSAGRDGRQWAVIGGPGCGVSTTLATIASGLLARDRRLCVVSGRSAPWLGLQRDPRILWCDDPGRVDELVALRRAVPDLAVLVDDADRLVDTPLDAALREVAACVDRGGGLVVVGARADALSVQYRGLAVAVTRQRTGVVLGPTSAATAEQLGGRLPVDRSAPPGRGYLVRAGVGLPIQVASTTVR